MSPASAENNRRSHFAVVTTLTLIGFGLRIVGLHWDGGGLFHPDEANLARAAAALDFPGGLVPDFHSYGELSLLLPWLLSGSSSDPVAISTAARLLSVLASTATIPVAAEIARRLSGRTAGIVAAMLFAFSSPLIGWAHFGTTESALMLVVSALVLLSVLYLDRDLGHRRFAVYSGLVGGIGLGMKISAAAFVLVPAAALFLSPRLTPAHWRSALLGACIAGGIWLAADPAVLFAFPDYVEAIVREGRIVRGSEDVYWTWQFADAKDGVFELRQLFAMLDGGVFMCAICGFALFAWRRDDRMIPALVFVGVYAAITFGWHAKFIRYLAPILPILLILAACFISQCLTGWKSNTVTTLLAGALAVFVVTGLLRATGFTLADPRDAAAEYVAEHATETDTVLVESREVIPSGYGVTRIVTLPPPDAENALDVIAGNLASADWLVLNSRRHWAVLPKLNGRFPKMCGYYRALFNGDLGLVPVKRFDRAPRLARLFQPGLSAEETRVVFDRPTVHVFRRKENVTRDDILARIDKAAPGCSLNAVIAARALAP